jgi:hypothetical protein
MAMLGNLGAFPRSYNDPLYGTLAHEVEQRLGLPAGILDAIRTKGERSNADQVSSAGARGVYQFIPSTRQGFIRNYGIDPWHDPQAQTQAAGQHLLDDFKRTGSWNKAIARYNGGINPPASSYRYQAQVGDFDADTSKPYYTGADQMPIIGRSVYPVGMEARGADPLAPEAPKTAVPIPGDAGPSANIAAASPVASKKRGGILGALESIFMPDPTSRWAGALRDGLFNAKESQRNYLEDQLNKQLDLQLANEKIKQLQTKGEYVPLGGTAAIHVGPNGEREIIQAPQQLSDKARLLQEWAELPPNHPKKHLIEQILLGTNSEDAFQNREDVARIRAGATTQSARIRANAPSKSTAMPPVPQGWVVEK